MKKENVAFAERLRKMLVEQHFGLKRTELVQQLAAHGKVSVTSQTVGGWLSGKHLPRPDAMRGLSRMLGTEPYLLAYGGKPVLEVSEPRTLWPAHVNGRDRLMFEAYLALPTKDRDAVRQMVDSLAAASAAKKPKRD